jgi:SAM-dependent methyltransferase
LRTVSFHYGTIRRGASNYFTVTIRQGEWNCAVPGRRFLRQDWRLTEVYSGVFLLSTQVSGRSERAVAAAPPVIDYEGSRYRTEFWEGQGRQYEDAAERLALNELLPAQGLRIAEIGAGFGRLADLYAGYEQIVLFDYSRTLLHEAAERWGHDSRFVFVAGNVYDLPLATAALDAVVMVRVMHHLADVDRALAQIRRVMHRNSVAVLEYANKRNLKALARWAARRQDWSPLDIKPVEFVELNFDFHPAWMWSRFEDARLRVRRQLAVSHFRLPLLKNVVPAGALAKMDSWLFELGGRYPLAPSVFVQATARDADPMPSAALDLEDLSRLLRCPVCFSERSLARVDAERMACNECESHYARRSGVWDFKERLA